LQQRFHVSFPVIIGLALNVFELLRNMLAIAKLITSQFSGPIHTPDAAQNLAL
jgi:hypothetical protein